MKKIIALLLISAMMLSFSACKKETGTGTKEEGADVQMENQTLKIHCYNLVSMNPINNINSDNLQMFRLIFEPLIQCDTTQKAQPVLASDYYASSDGLEWTVNLKKGIKWHDGTEFTAADVVYTYGLVRNDADSAYSYSVENIDSIYKENDYTVKFKIKEPQANFINLLEIPVIKAVYDDSFSPIGTGPYVYQETKNKVIYLQANEKWHGGEVTLKDIQVKIMPDEDTVTHAYVSKEIDMVSVNSGYEIGQYTSNSDNAIIDYASNSFNFIGINVNSEPLSNRLFRKAIAHGIDKESINSQVLLSHGSVANSCMNSKWWVYNPYVTVYEYSKDKSVNILNDVKKTMKVTPVSLMVNTENTDKSKAAEIIKKNLEECGITVNIEYVDWSTFTERVYSGNYQMYLGTLQYSSEINPRYVIQNPNVELQSLFVQLQAQTTEEGVKEKYCEIQEKIALDIYIIPLYFDVGAVLYNNRLQGNPTPCRTNIFNEIWASRLTS